MIAVAFVATTCGIGWFGFSRLFSDPPRQLDRPITVGMTIAEVGAARPTRYELQYPEIDESAASRRDMSSFTGWMYVIDAKGSVANFPFKGGKCTDNRSPESEPRTVYDKVPEGSSVAHALHELARIYKVAFQPDPKVFDLPEDLPRLKGFSGQLVGEEGTGWTAYTWTVTFENGIVTDFDEVTSYS